MRARNNYVDEGVISFGAILHNNAVMSDVTVEIAGRRPGACTAHQNHCVHVGSAVCASRMAKSGALITE